MIAKIAVSAANFAIDKPYSYAVPQGMALMPGMRVQVPFGRGDRSCEGVVLSLEEGSQEGLKAVACPLDSESLLSPTMLRLAAFMRSRYFCTYYDAVRSMLPAGLWFQSKQVFSLTQDKSWADAKLKNPQAQALLQMLQDMGGAAPEHILRGDMDEETFHKAVSYLLRKKWVAAQTTYRRKASDKVERIATLAVSAQEALAYMADRPKSALMQKSVLKLMCSIGSASVKEICYFTGASAATVNRLAELGYLQLSEKQVLRVSQIRPAQLSGPLVLNEEQQAVFDGLSAQMNEASPGAALLYGVTGSGKTSVYLKLIEGALAAGKTALLMVPEIALTPQLLGLLAAHFGQDVALLHSSLSTGERYDQFRRVQLGQARVVVGTRSAVFAPCQNLGLIIMDEEQEHSYISENAPRYCAKDIALWRSRKENALLLFGSATPSVESMYHARRGDYRLYRLANRYNGSALPYVQIVDMGEELRNGNDSPYSVELLLALDQTRKDGKQAVLFLNRRGNARAMVCVDCRQAPECPRCSARLTYHSANNRLMCHYCGYSQAVPKACPQCGGRLKTIGVGTQKAQQELLQRFPDMEVARMDADTVSAANTHEKILESFQKNRTPVLLGTQMVAKGLNLPDVTLVGVLDADLSLYSESYRAGETTFNMLTQVVGRAGRGDTPGRALVQTLVPEHPIIRLAAKQDYDGFYAMEIGLRQMQNLPPFGELAALVFTGENEQQVLRGAVKFRDSLAACLALPQYAQEVCTPLGPAPCPVPKINYQYRFRILLRLKTTQPLRLLLAHLLSQFSKDKENRGVSAYVDTNAME
ncbi:MAG: primosomal protein N' [Oscillospiraceae bacterium]|nr:primosomal protein N' [Oscillospiraceae bacterium]